MVPPTIPSHGPNQGNQPTMGKPPQQAATKPMVSQGQGQPLKPPPSQAHGARDRAAGSSLRVPGKATSGWWDSCSYYLDDQQL